MTPTLGGPIDPAFFARYNNTVQAALSSGPDVWVIIDVVSNRVNRFICCIDAYPYQA